MSSRPRITNSGGNSGGNTSNALALAGEDAEQEAAERNLIRRCVDYHCPAVVDIQNRLFYKSCISHHVRNRYDYFLIPHHTYIRHMSTPLSQVSAPIASQFYLTYCAHVTRAKNSTPIICLSWTPGGRRLLTGNHEGEFTLWDGINFSFELIMSAHDTSFRSMAWSHNRNYLLTSDASGNIKYWSPSIAPVQSIDSHNHQAIHALSFSPADTKFVSCGDDATVRIWDWATHSEERCLEGHGWDVKTVHWHPRSSVIASGSKDNLVKLWDARTGNCLSTLYGHKNTVTKVSWNDNGNWLLTSSRDQTIKLYDIRTMNEIASLKGHHKEVTSIAWNPLYESVFASGAMDGTLIFWNVGVKGSEEPGAKVPFAHDMAIWDLQWHPAGHVLATGSNDRQTKFWARNRLGSTAGLPEDQDALKKGSSTTVVSATGGPTLIGSSTVGAGIGGNNIVNANNEQQKSMLYESNDIISAEIELGNHVGIVIGRRGQTIISMQRATGTKMHVDQIRRVLLIQGTYRQIESVKKRVGALLERVSNEQGSTPTNQQPQQLSSPNQQQQQQSNSHYGSGGGTSTGSSGRGGGSTSDGHYQNHHHQQQQQHSF